MSTEAHSYWHGFPKIQHLVIFGDSYSDVGYLPKPHLRPSDKHPLGVPYPGVTWAEDDAPNWVGYLLKEFTPGHEFLVYDYAIGGHRVDGVVHQIQNRFIPDIGDKPDGARWSSDDTLFVTWIGINDLAFTKDRKTVDDSLGKLFEQQARLYELGARNFLFIDVPAVHRSPAVAERRSANVLELLAYWNIRLRHFVTEFASTRSDVTTLIYSSFALFSRILDNPEEYGFKNTDPRLRGGGIWLDHIHPTTKMHHEIARDIAAFLHTYSSSDRTGDTSEA
ncbi:hypothetical protein QCA50_011479 [Cerrena zonata]|uniref:Carbohydrate esterase family 16 protein n=1 Tax=Cerrena zonata TaxID=2478898 RepID=A0AAW0FZS0_9APHY